MNPDLNAPVDAANRLRTQGQQFLAGQKADTGDFLGRYTGAINAQSTMSALADRIGGELNLPQLRSNAQGLQNTLFNLPSTYGAATRGFDVNANQLSRIIGQKQSELAPAASLAQSNLSSAEGQLNTRLGYATADQNKQLLPYQSEQGLLSDRLAREASFYSNADQRELDAIIAKMNAGVTISEAEKQRAQQLSIAEKGYKNELDKAKISSGGAGSDRYKSIADGAWLYDTQTGQTIKNPQDFSGGGGASGPSPTINTPAQSPAPAYFTPAQR